MKKIIQYKLLQFLLLIICFSITNKLNAQNSFKEKTYFKGYIKDLRTAYLFDGLKRTTLESRIHNRLQFEWYINKNLTFDVEIRNQLIYGGFIKNVNELLSVSSNLPVETEKTTYGKQLQNNSNYINTSFLIFDNQSSLLLTQLDRFWLKWQKNKWEVQIGKQRINWGNNLIWNPNDLFNTQSFLDFDYEERPGADAIRFTYYKNYASRLELVFAPQSSFNKNITAILYQYNKKNYDFQNIVAYYKNELALGFGWAGNIKNAGFKGEFTYFQPFDNFKGNIVGGIGFDYSLQNGILIQAEILYNGFGESGNSVNNNLLSGNSLNPKNIWFNKYALAFNASYSVNPRLALTTATIISPSTNGFKNWSVFLVPTIQLTLSDDFDLLINAQISFPNDINLIGDFIGTEIDDPAPIIDLLGLQNNSIITANKLIGTVSTRLRWSF